MPFAAVRSRPPYQPESREEQVFGSGLACSGTHLLIHAGDIVCEKGQAKDGGAQDRGLEFTRSRFFKNRLGIGEAVLSQTKLPQNGISDRTALLKANCLPHQLNRTSPAD